MQSAPHILHSVSMNPTNGGSKALVGLGGRGCIWSQTCCTEIAFSGALRTVAKSQLSCSQDWTRVKKRLLSRTLPSHTTSVLRRETGTPRPRVPWLPKQGAGGDQQLGRAGERKCRQVLLPFLIHIALAVQN